MAKSLNEIPWDDLQDSCGPASGIPRAIQALHSEDESEREGAAEELAMGLCHQLSSVAEATSYAIPFLIDACSLGPPATQLRAVQLLAHIARVRQQSSPDAELPDDYLASEREWINRCQQTLWSKYQSLQAHLQSDDAQLRIWCSYALSGMLLPGATIAANNQPAWEAVAGSILSAKVVESDPLVSRGLTFALAEFSSRDERAKKALFLTARSEPDIGDRLPAVLSLAESGELDSRETEPVLTAFLREQDRLEPLFHGLPWVERPLRYRVIAALFDNPKLDLAPLRDALLQTAMKATPYGAFLEIVPILKHAQSRPDLASWLKELLSALAGNPRFWKGSSTGIAALRTLGLPCSPAEIREWVLR